MIPSTLGERLALVPRKFRQRGWAWLFKRLRVESVRGIKVCLRAVRDAIAFSALTLDRDVRTLRRNTFFAIYDLDVYPISYDISWFLVWADLERQKRKLRNLQCIFIPVADEAKREYPSGYAEAIDQFAREWRFANICVQTAQLLPARVGVTVCDSRLQFDTLRPLMQYQTPNGRLESSWATLPMIYRQTCEALSHASPPWGLKAQPQGLRYVRTWLDKIAKGRLPIVITLRQYAVDPQRNSRIDDWIRFSRDLDMVKYCPIFVPDTDRALVSQKDFNSLPVFAEAAFNVGLRMALYESAYLNMFVNCGPGSLCVLNDKCRYLFFKVSVEDVPLTSGATLKAMGFEKAQTPAFATRYQRWVWEDDKFEVLTREFRCMADRIESDNGPR